MTANHIDETSLKITKAVNALFAFTRDAYRDQFGDDKSHQREFAKRVAKKYAEIAECQVVDKPSQPKSANTKQPAKPSDGKIRIPTISPLVEQAKSLAEEIIDLAESGDLPASGIDYAESVAETARSIIETIESDNRATAKQVKSLENMLTGLQAWFQFEE